MTNSDDTDLASSSVGGALWFVAQTIVVKFATIGSQLALAYLLVPDDFGLIAIATAVAAVAGTLFRHGLGQVLVERAPRTHELAADAFWLSMAMAAAATALLAASAPLVAMATGEPQVRSLVLILALNVPLQAASVSPRARLLADLEFGKVARINGGQIVLRSALTVVFASFGWGAYSFAVAEPIASAVELLMYRRHRSLQAGRPSDRSEWPALTRDSGMLILAGVLVVVVAQGDYFVLGLFAPSVEVGLYYFAYRLSIQGVAIFTTNLARVVFPALMRLPRLSQRQYFGFLRAVRVLSSVGAPIGVLGALVGDDLIRAVFDDNWAASGELFQILCIAAVIRTVTDSYKNFLTVQGRFRQLLTWSAVIGVTFVIAVAIGAWRGDALGVAIAVAIHVSLSGWIAFTLAIRPVGGTAIDLPKLLFGPVVSSAVPALIGMAACRLVGYESGDWRRVVVPVVMAVVCYYPLLRVVSVATADELANVFRLALERLRRGRGSVGDREEGGQQPERVGEA